jgi:hypothetical protein
MLLDGYRLLYYTKKARHKLAQLHIHARDVAGADRVSVRSIKRGAGKLLDRAGPVR